MNSVVRCLAIACSLFLGTIAYSQEPEYIQAFGCIRNADGSLNDAKCRKQALDNLYEKILKESSQQVSSHTTLRNDNGKQDYKNLVAVDSGVKLPVEGIEFIHWDGFWIARIERSKVFPQEVKWVEQNITVNNVVNSAPTASRGYVRTTSITNTSKRIDVIGPSGKVVKTVPGDEVNIIAKHNWDGNTGYTRTTTRKKK